MLTFAPLEVKGDSIELIRQCSTKGARQDAQGALSRRPLQNRANRLQQIVHADGLAQK